MPGPLDPPRTTVEASGALADRPVQRDLGRGTVQVLHSQPAHPMDLVVLDGVSRRPLARLPVPTATGDAATVPIPDLDLGTHRVHLVRRDDLGTNHYVDVSPLDVASPEEAARATVDASTQSVRVVLHFGAGLEQTGATAHRLLRAQDPRWTPDPLRGQMPAAGISGDMTIQGLGRGTYHLVLHGMVRTGGDDHPDPRIVRIQVPGPETIHVPVRAED